MKWSFDDSNAIIFRQLAEVREKSEGGSYTIKGGGSLDRWRAIISTGLVDKEVSAVTKRQIITHVIFHCEFRNFREFISAYKKTKNDIAKKSRLYIVSFPMSGDVEVLGKRLSVNGVKLSFQPSRSSQLFQNVERSREEQRKNAKPSFSDFLGQLKGHPLAFARVRALSPHEAQTLATDAFQQALGVANFWLTYRSDWRSYSGPLQPIFPLLIGPHITVHDQKGAMPFDIFWYHEWFLGGSPWSGRKHRQRSQVARNTRNTISRSLNGAWSEEAGAVLSLFYESFSQFQPRSAFLLGWKVLEKIAGAKNTTSDTLVKRASSFFLESQEQRLLGRHLNIRRNELTHGTEELFDDGDTVAYHMKEFMTPMLRHFLHNPFEFEDLSEFWQFCDMPAGMKSRKRRRAVLEAADKFYRLESDDS